MGKALVLCSMAFVAWSLFRGHSLRRALWPLAWCGLGYAVLRFGVTSPGRLRMFVGVAVLLLPWIAAPYLSQWRAQRAARRARDNVT